VSSGELLLWDSSGTYITNLTVAGDVFVTGADNILNSSYGGNQSFGTLTLSGGTGSFADQYYNSITVYPTGRYWNSTLIHNNGKFVMSTPHDSKIRFDPLSNDSTGTNPATLYDLTINKQAGTEMAFNKHQNWPLMRYYIDNDLSVVSGDCTVGEDTGRIPNLTVTGDVVVIDVLNASISSGANVSHVSFGSLWIGSSGTYHATNQTTEITDNNMGMSVNNSGTLIHNDGTFLLNGTSVVTYGDSTVDRINIGSSAFYNVIVENGTIARYSDNDIDIEGNLTVLEGGWFRASVPSTGQYKLINVSGDAFVYGYLSSTGSFADQYYNSITVYPTGRYWNSNETVHINDFISLNGTFTYNSPGSINISGTNTEFANASNIKLEKVTSPPADNTTLKNIGYYINITNLTPTGSFVDGHFNITYNPGDVSGAAELKMWKHDGANWVQTGIDSTADDTTNDYVWSNITSFSVFAPMEDLTRITNCTNLTINGIDYKLINDIGSRQPGLNYCVRITGSNIELDGQGYEIKGISNAAHMYGINLKTAQGTTIKNVTVTVYFDSDIVVNNTSTNLDVFNTTLSEAS